MKIVKIRSMCKGIVTIMIDETMMREEAMRNSIIEGVMAWVEEMKQRYSPSRIKLNLFYVRIFPRLIWSNTLNEPIAQDTWNQRLDVPINP